MTDSWRRRLRAGWAWVCAYWDPLVDGVTVALCLATLVYILLQMVRAGWI